MPNKIYGLHLDTCKLCFGAIDFKIIQPLTEIGLNTDIALCDFTEGNNSYYFHRIDNPQFRYVYQLHNVDSDKSLCLLKFGLHDDDATKNTHCNGQNKIWLEPNNWLLYTSDVLSVVTDIAEALRLEFHNFTAIDIAMDMSMDVAHCLKRLIRCKKLTTLINGKVIRDRKEDRPELRSMYGGNMDRDKYLTYYIKSKKAIKDKSKGAELKCYNKQKEIEQSSHKKYISELYGNAKHIHRMEIHLNNEQLKSYFKSKNKDMTLYLLQSQQQLEQLFYTYLGRLIRFKIGKRCIEWEDILSGKFSLKNAKNKSCEG